MTPQLMQAIKLLQLSNLDLTTFVEEELERNPLLERASDEGGPDIPAEANYAEAGSGEGQGDGPGDDGFGGSADGFEPGQD
ncbi:hypothetical protein ABTA68_19830, partial [Acinetobacter baumannii]